MTILIFWADLDAGLCTSKTQLCRVRLVCGRKKTYEKIDLPRQNACPDTAGLGIPFHKIRALGKFRRKCCTKTETTALESRY